MIKETKKPKILFMFGGLPHYLIAQLNKLHCTDMFEVIVVVPAGKRATIGKGVEENVKGNLFQVVYTEEFITFYKKPFHKNFSEILQTIQPDILVTMWPYVLGFVLYPKLWKVVKRLNISLVLKEIPFMVPKLGESSSFYKQNPVFDENLVQEPNSGFFFLLKNFVIERLRKKYYSRLSATVNYVEEAKNILPTYNFPPDKIFVTYNSPDTDELFEAKAAANLLPPLLPENKHRILHVGRLVKWKKVDLLIQSVSRLKNKYADIELVVIGKGPEENALKKLAEELNISEKIIFAGGIYQTVQLAQYLKETSIYVLAGMGGLSINEAMVCGKPIICSVCDGTEKHLVRNGYNGYFFQDDSLEDLSEKIDLLLSNPQKMNEMGENSYKIIANEININTVITKYIEAFNFVLKNKK